MRGATWMLLGVGSFAGVASGQGLNFTTVIDSKSTLGASADTITRVDQVVLQDDNAVAALVRFGDNAQPPDAVTFSPTPGNSAAQIVARSGQLRSTFGVGGTGGAGAFADFFNLSSTNGIVTFGAGSFSALGGRGLFRYTYDPTTPTRSTIHFEGDAISGASSSIDTDGGSLPAYGVNGAGHVVFAARTVAPSTPGTQLIARNTGGASTRIHDTSGGITNFNLADSYFFQRKLITSSDHAVFVGDAGDGRRIYDIGPGADLTPAVRIEKSLGGTYEPARVLGATGDAVTGITLFDAFKNRPAPLTPGAAPDDTWSAGALLVNSPLGLREIGSYDTSAPSINGQIAPPVTAVMSGNGRVAAFLPQDTGGRVVYFDAATSAAAGTTIAQFGTAVGGGFTIKHVSLDYVSAPMVNARGTVVFDAVIQNGDDVRDALLAWTPGSATPFVVAKTGDTITIGGASETIGEIGFDQSTFGPLNPFPADLGYDADVVKDGLNDNDYLAFAVRFVNGEGVGNAVLLTQVPEPAALSLISVSGMLLLRRRRRWIGAEKNSGQGEGIPDRCRRGE